MNLSLLVFEFLDHNFDHLSGLCQVIQLIDGQFVLLNCHDDCVAGGGQRLRLFQRFGMTREDFSVKTANRPKGTEEIDFPLPPALLTFELGDLFKLRHI